MSPLGDQKQNENDQDQALLPLFISFGLNGVLKTLIVTLIFSLFLFPILQIIVLKLLLLLSEIDMHNLGGLKRTTRLIAASLIIAPLLVLISPLFSFLQLKNDKFQHQSIFLKHRLKSKKHLATSLSLLLITILAFIVFYLIIVLLVYLTSSEEGRLLLADDTLIAKVIIGLFIITNFVFQFFLIAIVIFQHYYIYCSLTIKETIQRITQIFQSHWIYLGLLCNIIMYMIGILFFYYKDIVNWILDINLTNPDSIGLGMTIIIDLLFILAGHFLVSLFLGVVYKTIHANKSQ